MSGTEKMIILNMAFGVIVLIGIGILIYLVLSNMKDTKSNLIKQYGDQSVDTGSKAPWYALIGILALLIILLVLMIIIF